MMDNAIPIQYAESDPLSHTSPLHKIELADLGVVVGSFSIVNGEFHFDGNAAASARIFFDEVLKPLCDKYIREAKR